MEDENLGMRNAGGSRRLEDNCDLAIRGVGYFPKSTGKREGGVGANDSGIMQGKGEIEGNAFGDGLKEGAAFRQSLLPTLVGDFLSFRVDMLVVVEINFFLKDSIGFSQVSDVIALAEVRDAALEIVKRFFYFAFGLRISLGGKLDGNAESGKSSGELGVGLCDGAGWTVGRPEDAVVVAIVSDGAAEPFEGLADSAKVMPGGVGWNQEAAHDLSGVIVFGEDEDIVATG